MVVKLNGEVLNGANGTYTVSNVHEDLTITVEGIEREPLPDREIPVSDGLVDIDDKTLYNRSSYYNATATGIKISGAVVKEAYQLSGSTTVYMILAWDTSDTAEITVEFQATLNNSELLNGTDTIQLEDGEGNLQMTITGKRKNSNSSSYKGSEI